MTVGQLPRWADYVLMPAINVIAAFLVAGLVVLLIGENPVDAVEVLLWGALGWNEGIGFTLFYATNFIFTGSRSRSPFMAAFSTSAGKGRPISAGSASRWPVWRSIGSFPGG